MVSTKLRNAFQAGFLSLFVMQYLQCNSDMTPFAVIVIVSPDYAVMCVSVYTHTYMYMYICICMYTRNLAFMA